MTTRPALISRGRRHHLAVSGPSAAALLGLYFCRSFRMTVHDWLQRIHDIAVRREPFARSGFDHRRGTGFELMRMIVALGTLACISACGGNRSVLDLEPTKHELVDNLFIAKSGGGSSALMNAAVGTFSLRGRCLVLDTDGTPRTPIFAGKVDVGRSGIVIAGRKFPYGEPQRLPMIGPPLPIKSMAGSACPSESLFVRSVAD